MNTRGVRRLCVAACATALALGSASSARAADRPFISASSAAADEGDHGTWAFDAWTGRLRSLRNVNASAEYAFVPTTSLELEASHDRDRAAGVSATSVGLELKQLFNPIARDGYGWGVVASLGMAKHGGDGWKRDEVGVNLPVTLSLWNGAGALHLNAGAVKPRDERRQWTRVLALERAIVPRVTGFAELAREGQMRIAHVGARLWLQRETLVVDVGWQRQRDESGRASGWLLGVGWYGL